jgi:hypothetical protein
VVFDIAAATGEIAAEEDSKVLGEYLRRPTSVIGRIIVQAPPVQPPYGYEAFPEVSAGVGHEQMLYYMTHLVGDDIVDMLDGIINPPG